MANGENQSKRNLLGRQPARAILIDVSQPFDQFVCSALCSSLENLFSVACAIAGPSRIPLVSIFLLTAQPEVLLPLSSLKGNFTRIQSALKTIQECVSDGCGSLTHNNSCVAQAVYMAIEQFKRQVCTFTQPGLTFSQLEVIIVSCQSGESLSRRIEAAADSLHIQHLKRIVCVTLTPLYRVDETMIESNSQNSGASTNSVLSGLVDTVSLDADSMSLANFFCGWLMDCGSDSEHLHIVLPSQYPGGQETTLKCDFQERILNPAQLPHNTAYTLHPESATCKMVFVSTSKAAGISIPIHRIRVQSLIHSKHICESILFGMPLIVQPTSCWKVDWDELEQNQLIFRALCHLLHKKSLVMLGQVQHEPPIKNCSSTPCGWFVFLPGPNHTLLVKSVAVKELLLPSLDTTTATEEPSEETLDMVRSLLDKVEQLDSFNPLTLDSGLYDSLKFQPRARGSAQAKKRGLHQDTNQRAGLPVNKVRGVSTFTVNSTQQHQQHQQQHQQRQHQQQQWGQQRGGARRPVSAFSRELE